MAVDPLSPVAPARIRALLLPMGRIKRSRFLAFVDLVQPQCIVRLGDITPDSRPDRNMFSPLAFPHGFLLYDLSTSLSPPSHLSLSPFEQFREPLLVIGIGDATEYPWLQKSHDDNHLARSGLEEYEPAPEDDTGISSAVDDIREQFPQAYLHTLMMFDSSMQSIHPQLPPETMLVPPVAQLKTTTMKTFMCDLSSKLLAELTTFARSIQALPTVASPASQGGIIEGTPAWTYPDSLPSRRNSQTPTLSRQDSPVSANQKDFHRMSMPVLPSSSGAPSTVDDPRAASPSVQGARTPPTTFDDIAAVGVGNSLNRANSNSSRPGVNARESSIDRVSIQGFGSGGVGERARNKGRGRVSIVIGTLYLCAGQWHEALRELTDGATRARAFSDHLWHGKALENILVCLLLFAWSGMDFQIPSLCYPNTDKSGTKSPQHTPSSSLADVASIPSQLANHDVALESLNSLLPDLVNMVLNVYTRASNFAGESLPPLAFSECVIRFSKLLAAMNLSAGYLDDDALQHLVQNTPFRQKPRLSVPRLSVNPTRNDIATLLFRALPTQNESSGISATDRVVILAGIASVLSALGLQRKKAIVMKEFINSLIPGLVQARKVGAAEMGVHPAAGLAALNMVSGGASGAGALNLGEGEVENGIDEFLSLLGRIYGIPDSKAGLNYGSHLSNGKSEGNDGSVSQASQAIVEEILRTSSLRSFGSLALKLDILRMCINFCEALPDFNGVLHFTALLLRMAGPGTAPKSNSTDVFVALARDEQTRLYANISRTVTAANKLGLQHIETDYWDDFLVRGISVLEEPKPLQLTHHQPAEIKATTTGKEGPFLHNPWLKQPVPSATETVLVANEHYKFIISLQNPYEFELEIQSLRIAADGIELAAREEYFILGPYRTQKFPILGSARSPGKLIIRGCYIKVTGCRERLFPIFPEPWKPEREAKMKRIGLQACFGAPSSRPASATAPIAEPISALAPKPELMTFTVIPDQPVVIVTDVSLPQGALMVLEGERKRFMVTLQNTSQTTAVDFVHVSFQDSATASIQAGTSNKDIPAAELHELEVQLAHHPSLIWCKPDDEIVAIKPGEKAHFEIEVVGRIRLTDAIIQFDYAHLSKRRSEVSERFFTRQVSVPISITVNASVQLQRPDIVPLSSDFAWSNQQNRPRTGSAASQIAALTPSSILVDKHETYFQILLRHTRLQGHGDEYCMLLLDLRNSWPNPLSISLQVRTVPTAENEQSEDSWSKAYTVNEVIQPGHINRVVLILPKVYLDNPFAAVPSLNPANQRQFVVSASKLSPEAERATREAFWYRHELLKLVRGSWKEETNGRRGGIELRGIRFSPRMVDSMKLDDIMIETSVVSDHSEDTGDAVLQVGRARFEVAVDVFLKLKTKIHNRSAKAISPVLRLQPHLAGLPHNVALDLDKRFSWNGVLQRRLPVIEPGQHVQSELGIVALCGGMFEIGATVEEAELLDPGEEEGLRPRSETNSPLENATRESKLRFWHLKEPCTIIAKRNLNE